MYRIVLYDGGGPSSNASSTGLAGEARDVGSGGLSSGVVGVLPGSVNDVYPASFIPTPLPVSNSPGIDCIYMRLMDDTYFPKIFPVCVGTFGRPRRGFPSWQVCASIETELVSVPAPCEEPMGFRSGGGWRV